MGSNVYFHYHCFFYIRVCDEYVLYLLRFDANTPYFHLAIDPAQQFVGNGLASLEDNASYVIVPLASDGPGLGPPDEARDG